MLQSQEFVTTDTTFRNVVLEEFTGRNCGNCPIGHRISNEIMLAHDGRFFPVNIHYGPYVSQDYPNFRTEKGDEIARLYNMAGFPCGVVNRISDKPLPPVDWSSKVEKILPQYSELNIDAVGIIDTNNRILHLTIELYYTGNSKKDTNYLTAFLLQNNILGRQAAGYLNLYQWKDSIYNHTHVFRDVITETFGNPVAPTTAGSCHKLNIDYVIPDSIGNPEGVKVVPKDLEVVVMVAEDKMNVITANTARMFVIDDIASCQPSITSTKISQPTYCSNYVNVKSMFTNLGEDVINTMTINYGVNNHIITQQWSGAVNKFNQGEISFSLPFDETTDTVFVDIVEVNGMVPNDNGGLHSFVVIDNNVIYDVVGNTMLLKLWQDKLGEQTTWEFANSEGEVLFFGGPYDRLADTVPMLHEIELPDIVPGCYTFEIKDSFGNGINSGYGAGHYQIEDEQGNVVFDVDGNFGFYRATNFYVSDEEINYVDVSPTVNINGGDVMGGGTFPENTTILLAVAPFADYEFLGWYINGEYCSDSTIINYVVQDDDSIVARFKHIDGMINMPHSDGITIFPNPTSGIITFGNVDDNVDAIIIYDMNGKFISRIEYKPVCDLHFLPKGTYIVCMVANGRVVDLHKLLKE